MKGGGRVVRNRNLCVCEQCVYPLPHKMSAAFCREQIPSNLERADAVYFPVSLTHIPVLLCNLVASNSLVATTYLSHILSVYSKKFLSVLPCWLNIWRIIFCQLSLHKGLKQKCLVLLDGTRATNKRQKAHTL